MDNSGHHDLVKDLEKQIEHLKKLGADMFFGKTGSYAIWRKRKDITFVYGRASDDTSKLPGGTASIISAEEFAKEAAVLLRKYFGE